MILETFWDFKFQWNAAILRHFSLAIAIKRAIRIDCCARKYVLKICIIFLHRWHILCTCLPTPLPTGERRLPVIQFHVTRAEFCFSLQIYAFLFVLPPRYGTAMPHAGIKRPDNAVWEASLVWKCNITRDTGAGMRARGFLRANTRR